MARYASRCYPSPASDRRCMYAWKCWRRCMELAPTKTRVLANHVAQRRDAPASIPVAPGLPFIGNAVDLLQRPLEFFVQSYHDLGPIFRATGPGRDYVIMAGPVAKAFLLDWGGDYPDNKPLYQGGARPPKAPNHPLSPNGAAPPPNRPPPKPPVN